MRYIILFLLTLSLFGKTAAEQYVDFRKTLPKFQKNPLGKKVEQMAKLPENVVKYLDQQQQIIEKMVQFLNQLPEDQSRVLITKEIPSMVQILVAGKLLLYKGRYLCEGEKYSDGFKYYKQLHLWIALIRREETMIATMISIALERLLLQDMGRFYQKLSAEEAKGVALWFQKRKGTQKMVTGAIRGEYQFMLGMKDEIVKGLEADLGGATLTYLQMKSGMKDIKGVFLKKLVTAEEQKRDHLINSYRTGGLKGLKKAEDEMRNRFKKVQKEGVAGIIFSAVLMLAPTREGVESMLDRMVAILGAIASPYLSKYVEKVEAISKKHGELLQKIKKQSQE